jgi:dihydroflavonol-4-reductase
VVRDAAQGRLPAFVDTGLNLVDVRDVAAGHLLADRKGTSGERYILGGRNFTLQRLFSDLARISGASPPALRLPAPMAIGGVELARRLGIPLPVSREEVRSGTLWWTYRSTKARKELGFEARPHEETLEDAVRWQLSVLGDRVALGAAPLDVPLRAAGRALRVGERLLAR